MTSLILILHVLDCKRVRMSNTDRMLPQDGCIFCQGGESVVRLVIYLQGLPGGSHEQSLFSYNIPVQLRLS